MAEHLQLSRAWVYRNATSLGAVRIGSNLRFTWADVHKFVERHRLDAGMRARTPR